MLKKILGREDGRQKNEKRGTRNEERVTKNGRRKIPA